MANQKQLQKEMTPEEIRAQQRNFARKTLENKVFQGVLGGNQVRSNPFLYGQFGVTGAEGTYEESMGSDDAKKARDAAYKRAKARGDSLGVYGEPAITNYEVSADIIQQIEENKQRLPLGDLVEIVKGVAPGFKFDLPEALKDYVIDDIQTKINIAKATSRREDLKVEDILTETEYDALMVYQGILSQAYNRGFALRTAQPGYFADLNSAAEKVSEKYKPKEEKK